MLRHEETFDEYCEIFQIVDLGPDVRRILSSYYRINTELHSTKSRHNWSIQNKQELSILLKFQEFLQEDFKILLRINKDLLLIYVKNTNRLLEEFKKFAESRLSCFKSYIFDMFELSKPKKRIQRLLQLLSCTSCPSQLFYKNWDEDFRNFVEDYVKSGLLYGDLILDGDVIRWA